MLYGGLSGSVFIKIRQNIFSESYAMFSTLTQYNEPAVQDQRTTSALTKLHQLRNNYAN